MGELRAAGRRAWPFAAITGGTALAAFLALPAQSLPDKYAAGDANLLFPYAFVALLTAGSGVVAVTLWRGRAGADRRWRHLPVPLALSILVPAVLAACGGARSRWLTGLLCAAAAAGVHLALELPHRRHSAVMCGIVAAAAVSTAAGCQTAWRAEDFRATGLPFVVAEVPGYRLTGTYADVGVIFLQYREVAGTGVLDATISRRTCEAAAEEQKRHPGALAPGVRCLDLPDGHHLSVGPPHPPGYPGDTAPIPAGIAVRQVSAVHLASFPVSSESLPD
ncbi:hypothetical protein AB0M20_21620 [Actinoplanes sp. NPDC051633]|uniref:hypothetical protein n=1 Tax=Actinoplanes sp. NPDC051633 TaxID=3155670 RepID=UPI00342892FE